MRELAGGNISEEYIFFGGKRIARRVVSPSSVFYYFADHLGSSRVIVQANQTTACYEADNTPYGKERIITDTCPQNYKFTGKERDTESSLDYMGARYYSWGFGRFHSPDVPFIDQHLGDPQSWNLYAYARNNPLIFTDPTGNAVDGPMSGTGLLPGVHHGGGVSVSMLSGATSYSWGYALLTVGGESSETTTTSANVQQAAQPQQEGPKPPQRPAWANTWLGSKLYSLVDGDAVGTASRDMVESETWVGKAGAGLAGVLIVAINAVPGGGKAGTAGAQGVRWTLKNLLAHFGRHGKQMGFEGAYAYGKAGLEFFQNPSTLRVMRQNGEAIFFNATSGYFGTATREGVIKTFFRPDNPVRYLLNEAFKAMTGTP